VRAIRVLPIAAALLAAAPGAGFGGALPADPRAALSFVGVLRPSFTADMETRIPLGSAPPASFPGRRAGAGPRPEHVVRDWMVTLAIGPGFTFAKPDGQVVALTATARAGLMKRLSGEMQKRVAVVLVGWVNPEAVGPAVRFEAAGNLGVQAGWLFVGNHADGALVSIDATFALIGDILNPSTHRE
jgi:hypothetical protein